MNLGGERVLWLFGDSFVGPVDTPGTRSGSKMIRNTAAIQHGLDPANATFTVYYDDTNPDTPAPLFTLPDAEDTWLWPGPGIRLGDTLLLGFVEVAPTSTGLGFETRQSHILLVDNPDDTPDLWEPRPLTLPETLPRGVQIAFGAWYADTQHLYAFAPVEPGSHDVFLARWTLEEARAQDVQSPQWWSGAGWADADAAAVVIPEVQTEFSVSRGPDGALWLIAVDGFGGTNIVLRTAQTPEGPWSEARVLFRPAESDRDGALVYSAKAHPALEGADLILTWCSNHLDFWTMAGYLSLYFPRYLRVNVAP